MRKPLLLFLTVTLLLSGCFGGRDSGPAIDVRGPWESDPDYQDAMAWNDLEGVYVPDRDLGPYEVVEAFFEQHYKSYVTNQYIDVSSILDMEQTVNRNMEAWTQLLLQRRRLIAENNLAYVETRMLPYSISFEDDANDERMDFWNVRNPEIDPDERVLHFVITGEEGHAYPPMMAMNAQHTMRLREIEGQWRITFHYFPGSVRKYYLTRGLAALSDEDCLGALREEFAAAGEASAVDGGGSYSGALAAEYAGMYTERGNPAFYHIGDWMGNCQNFISQAVWYGFGGADSDAMTEAWFGGTGGGSPAWENVGYFWRYITGGQGMRGQIIDCVSELQAGDIIQTRTLGGEQEQERGFSHSLMVVDEETLKLAQNSPGCFVYYSDVFRVETRMIRPVALT